MYGDFESCDSTIKLGEFCSWLVVCPFPPSHRSPPVIYYGSTALSHPLPPSICCTTGEKEEDRNLSRFLLPANFRREREGRFKYNAIIPRARKRMTGSRMIHQSRAVSAELIRGRSVHGFSRFSNVSIETLTFHRSPERRIQLAIREDRSSVHRATSNTVLTEALRTSRSVPRREARARRRFVVQMSGINDKQAAGEEDRRTSEGSSTRYLAVSSIAFLRRRESFPGYIYIYIFMYTHGVIECIHTGLAHPPHTDARCTTTERSYSSYKRVFPAGSQSYLEM